MNMQRTNVTNYVTSNRFYVAINGVIGASFYQMTGLGFSLEKKTYAEGGLIGQQCYYLNPVKFKDIKLKRGITKDKYFLEWAFQLLQEKPTFRRTVDIFAYNQAGEVMQQWLLQGAQVIGWDGPMLKADGNLVAFEELTIAYQSLTCVGMSYSAGFSLGDDVSSLPRGISVESSLSTDGFGVSVSASLRLN